MKKQILSVFLTLCMMSALLSANVAFAATANSVYVGGVELTDGSYALDGTYGGDSGEATSVGGGMQAQR